MLKRLLPICLIASVLLLIGCASNASSKPPTVTPRDVGIPTSVPASGSATQDPFDHYPVGTLSGLTTYALEHMKANTTVTVEDPDTHEKYSFDAGLDDKPLTRAQVTYTGECQDIPTDRLKMMEAWINRYNADVSGLFTDLFKQQCRYTEGDTEYWMPTQSLLVDELSGKLKEGDSVTLYVQYLGTILPLDADPAKYDHIFIVNQYTIVSGG
jgi:hypothetical protein